VLGSSGQDLDMVGAFIFDEVEREDCSVHDADPSSPELSELFEAHFQSKTHRRCVDVFLLLPHNLELRREVSSWLDPLIKDLRPTRQCDEIADLVSQYTDSGYSVAYTQFLCKALLMLQAYMKAELRALMVKKLSIEFAMTESVVSSTRLLEDNSDPLLSSRTYCV
jgi:hypothetical protein